MCWKKLQSIHRLNDCQEGEMNHFHLFQTSGKIQKLGTGIQYSFLLSRPASGELLEAQGTKERAPTWMAVFLQGNFYRDNYDGL